jgi:exodeoxyribonuclease VII small subunit
MASNGTNIASRSAHGDNRPSFEQDFTRLQEVVAKLTDRTLTLQEALSAYEEGMALADRCATMLDEAELRVKEVSERALRSASSSLTDLDVEMQAQTGDGAQRLVAIEIESHEATLLFGDQPATEPDPVPAHTSRPDTRPTVKADLVSLDDLDPLFDEED